MSGLGWLVIPARPVHPGLLAHRLRRVDDRKRALVEQTLEYERTAREPRP